MNCPSCGVSVTFLGDWDNAMQYKCERCKYEISMTKTNILRQLTEDDFKFIMTAGWCERETMDYDENRFKQIKEQFLKNQEYVGRVGEKHLDEIVENKVIVYRLKKEIESMGVSSHDYHAYEVEEILEDILRGKKNED